MESPNLLLVINIVALTVLTVSVGVAVWSTRADHERRKKQATLEFYAAFRKRRDLLIEELRGTDGTPLSVTAEGLEAGAYPRSQRRNMRHLLGELEMLAAGANLGILDIDVVAELGAHHIVDLYSRLRPLVERSRQHRKYRYEHLVALIDTLTPRERPQRTPGAIRHT